MLDSPLYRIIDLSHLVESGMPVPRGHPDVTIRPIHSHVEHEGDSFSVAAHVITIGEHVGTHIDAPYHFSLSGSTVEHLSLEPLVFGWARRLCFPDLPERTPINQEMMRQADDAAGGLKPREAAFIDTGYWKHWGTESFFAAPYMTLDAAELLVDRGISLLVVDASTPDDTRASGRPVHEKILKEHSIPIIEGATNLDELPQRPFRFVALPLKLKGGSGSPIRLIGIVDR